MLCEYVPPAPDRPGYQAARCLEVSDEPLFMSLHHFALSASTDCFFYLASFQINRQVDELSPDVKALIVCRAKLVSYMNN
eukprot:1139395-Pelagomonas_calceolata.AAC.2